MVAVRSPRVAIGKPIALVAMAIVALIAILIPTPVALSPVVTAFRMVVHRKSDAAGQANQGGRK